MSKTRHTDVSDSSVVSVVRRAFDEFLMLPTIIVAGFAALAVVVLLLDAAAPPGIDKLRTMLESQLFSSARTTADLLGTVASGLLTVTSITISLLLLALQQAATSLTSQVYEQFLRRRENQMFFAYFIGVTLFALLTLASVDARFNPVLGATLTLALTAVALLLLLVMLYSAIDQMRPTSIVDTIHDLTLAARRHQEELLARTCRAPRLPTVGHLVRADRHGFVTGIDLDTLDRVINNGGELEIVLKTRIGDFVAFGEPLAEIGMPSDGEPRDSIVNAVRGSIKLERQRDVGHDPAFGITQLETIAWTSISSAKSDPSSGQLCIRSLRDLMARWCEKADEEATPGRQLPIVYNDDTLTRLMDAYESLAVVASESMQHHSLAEILEALTLVFDRLPDAQRSRVEDLLRRSLSALGDHVPTKRLDEAMQALAVKLAGCGKGATAAAVDLARRQHAHAIGKLNSRSRRGSGGSFAGDSQSF